MKQKQTEEDVLLLDKSKKVVTVVLAMNNMKLPVGIDQFDKLIKSGFYYVDKTRLIEQLYKLGRSKSIYTSSAFWKDFEYEYAEILF